MSCLSFFRQKLELIPKLDWTGSRNFSYLCIIIYY